MIKSNAEGKRAVCLSGKWIKLAPLVMRNIREEFTDFIPCEDMNNPHVQNAAKEWAMTLDAYSYLKK